MVCFISYNFYLTEERNSSISGSVNVNLTENFVLVFDREARVFLERGEQRIGRVYRKAVYQQYTDSNYMQEIEKPKWLGFLGPLISAEENDIVVVHLKNMAKRAYSIHAHGLSYNKSFEGDVK